MYAITMHLAQMPVIDIFAFVQYRYSTALFAKLSQLITRPYAICLVRFWCVNVVEPDRKGFFKAWAAHSHAVPVVHGCHPRSEEHTSELQSRGHLVCRLLLEKKNKDTEHGSHI